LATVAREYRRERGAFPADYDALVGAWEAARDGVRVPVDPFDGKAYGYVVEEGSFLLWSSGPDGESGTDDDITVRSSGPPPAPG
jgi:hypothetical protein